MKMNYPWVAAVVLASAVGYWVGKVSGIDTANDGEAVVEAEAAARVGFQDDKPVRSVRRGKTAVGYSSRPSQKAFDKILADLEWGEGEYSDPFGISLYSFGIGRPGWVRLCDWAMDLPRTEFPEVMEKARKPGGRELNQGIAAILVQRWVEFDPDAARSWVRGLAEEYHDDHELVFKLRTHLVQEALLHHPRWAAEELKGLYKEMTNYNASLDPEQRDDPFGGASVSIDFNLFFWRLAAMPAVQRDELVAYMGTDVMAEGMDGWNQGMVRHGGEQDFLKLYQQAKQAESIYAFHKAFEQKVLENWQEARAFVEKYDVEVAEDIIWERWNGDDAENAHVWFISRARDQEEKARRIARVASTLGSIEERKHWIDEQEARGEPVVSALGDLVESMAQAEKLDEALSLVFRLPDEKQEAMRVKVYLEAAFHGWFKTKTGESISYFLPHERHVDFANRDQGFREYIRKTNQMAMEEFARLLEPTME